MEYQFIKPTRRYKVGDTLEMNPDHEWTRQRLERGIVEPVRKPKAAKREKKVVDSFEVKDDSQDE